MTASILDGRRILAVDDEPDVLAVLERRFLGLARIARSTRPLPLKKPPK